MTQEAGDVSLSPATSSLLKMPDGVECRLPEHVTFTMRQPSAATMSATADLYLPIAGATELGAEVWSRTMGPNGPNPMGGLLKSGSVSVFGRTNAWFSPSVLYTVPDSTMEIPAGARLTGGNIEAAPQHLPPPWYGLARIDMDNGMFVVSASTISSQMQLFRPDGEEDGEYLGLRLITRLLNDPILALLVIGLAVFSFMFQLLSGLFQLDRKP